MNKKKIQETKKDGMKFVKRELDALEKMKHPNIVRVLDLCEDDNDICIVMELMNDGNLLEFLQDRFVQK